MACTPFVVSPGLFENSTQGVWLNAPSTTQGGKTVTLSGGTLTVTGPNGTMNFSAAGTQILRYKFFGTGNFLAVLVSESGVGPITRWMHIVNFVAPAITSKLVLTVPSTSAASLPFVNHSPGTGAACCIGGSTGSDTAGIGIYRSDTGDLLCAGPPPFTPSNQIIGFATATTVEIRDGGATIGGPCPLPRGSLDVQPNAQTFSDVVIGGCPGPASTNQFTLKNNGTDCLTVSAIANSGPYAVTSTSQPLPHDLAPNQSITVTVTFAPGAVGSFNNVNLAVTRTPAQGDDKLICSGKAVAAAPAVTVAPAVIDFDHVLVGTTSAPKSFAIKNTGTLPISVSLAGAPAGTPFQWAGFTGMLTCGQTQTVAVTFTPTADGPASPQTATIVTPIGNRTVTLTGDGCVPDAKIVPQPAPFPAFGDVRQGYRMPRFITVHNTGDATLTFTASISGPDAALFGLMKPSQSITDVAASRSYTVLSTDPCGGGPAGDGVEEVAVVFFANAAPSTTATATLTIDGHNDPSAAPAFSYALTAQVIAGNTVDVVAVFDRSGSMGDAVPGGGTKMTAAISAGKLLAKLIPPDLRNRLAGTLFSTTASTFLPIGDVTSANQQGSADAIADPPLTPAGSTAIAAGAMVGLKEFATPHSGGTPPNLTKSLIVLTDGKDNTAYKNPDDNQFYTVTGISAHDPANLASMVSTLPFVAPSDVKVFAIGLGTAQDIDAAQLDALSSATGSSYNVVDPTKPTVQYELMKLYTQIYMDMVDMAVIKDPRVTIHPGQKHENEFDLLRGDVGAMAVLYDLKGIRLPFYFVSPRGEIVDASFVPAGFQLRSGFTESTRFLEFRVPLGEPDRYAGRWKLVVEHQGQVCKGRPDVQSDNRRLGFLPRECGKSKDPVEYGFAIGAGSNFQLQAYVSPGPIKVGESILLTGVVTEAGLPITGCTVTVEPQSPNGQLWPVMTLKDDGAHDDGTPDDGEYAARFTKTGQAGSYTFRFRATGLSRDGELVTREAVRSKYVEGYVKEPPRPDPPGHGQNDECCKRLLALIEREYKLLQEIAGKNPPRKS